MGQTSSLYLPAQSGKTSKMKERIDQMNKCIHIIISSNNKTLVEQTSTRMGPETFIWHSGRKGDVYWEIVQGVTTIVCCANRTRFDAIEMLLDKLESDELFTKKICIWMDEGDAYIGLWKGKKNKWSKLKSVVIISATQDACLKEFGEIRVLPYEKTFPDTYQNSSHCNFVEFNLKCEAFQYVSSVLSSTKLSPGMRLFIPGDKKRSSHYDICNLLLKKNTIVCVLNGDSKCIYFPESFRSKPIHLSGTEEIGKKISCLYHTLEMHKYPFAITGHDCISRGITFQTSDFFFTHAIISQIDDSVKAYQMTSRMFGNILQYEHHKPIVVTTTNMVESVKKSEGYAMTMAKQGKIVTREMMGLSRTPSVIMEEERMTIPISENVSENLMKILITGTYEKELITSILEYRLQQDGNMCDIDTFTCKQIITPKRSSKFTLLDYSINNKKPLFLNFNKKDMCNVWQAYIDVKNNRIVFMIYMGCITC
jgi:hypothetical protein